MIEHEHWLTRLRRYREEMEAKKAEIDALFPGGEDPELEPSTRRWSWRVSRSTIVGSQSLWAALRVKPLAASQRSKAPSADTVRVER